MSDAPLFCDGELDASLAQIRQDMLAAIAKESEEYLLNADEDQWADHLADEYAVACPDLHADAMEIEDLGEAQIDVSHHHDRAIFDRSTPTYVPGRKLLLHIPFSGDGNVFKLIARTRSYSPPHASVARDEIRVTYGFPHPNKPDIKGEAQQLVSKLQQHLGWSRADIEQHNAALRQQALAAIRARKQRILSDHGFLDDLGIPVRRRDDAPKTYAAPGIERRPASKPKAKAAKPQPLEPVMVGDLYDHSIRVIRAMGRAMERTPGIYAAHEEEQLRDQLLAMLNSHYEGQATGETFNASGKTDILVRVEDRNVFIGECKWWSGPAGFLKALGQLFGYATWRDTKLALVMFVRAKGLTALVAKAKAELEGHSEFVEWQPSEETELRCRMRWSGDPDRHADLTVSFFHLPEQL